MPPARIALLLRAIGTGTQISGSGSRKIWPIKNSKPLYYLYNWLAPQNMSVERELKFQAPAPPFNIFWLRFHSPASSWFLRVCPPCGHPRWRQYWSKYVFRTGRGISFRQQISRQTSKGNTFQDSFSSFHFLLGFATVSEYFRFLDWGYYSVFRSVCKLAQCSTLRDRCLSKTTHQQALNNAPTGAEQHTKRRWTTHQKALNNTPKGAEQHTKRRWRGMRACCQQPSRSNFRSALCMHRWRPTTLAKPSILTKKYHQYSRHETGESLRAAGNA